MSTATITWRNTIDARWLAIEPTRIGEIPSGLGTPDKYVLVAEHDEPLLRVDAYPSSDECFAFKEAVIWLQFLVVGWGGFVYLIDLGSRAITKHALSNYFGHIYANDEYLLVASAERLHRIDKDGTLQWTSDVLGIDGVVVGDVSDGTIHGDGEWDPPGGWIPFSVHLDSGQNVKQM